jgi:hypothetical protein
MDSSTKAYLDECFSRLATKEDLESLHHSLRNWIIAIWLSTTALKLAVQYAMFQLYIR